MPPPEEREQWACTVCGRVYFEDEQEPEGNLHTGDPFCDNCEDRIKQCQHCDEYHEINSGEYYNLDEDGEGIACSDCYSSEGYQDCACCGYTTHPDDTSETEDGSVCGQCFEDEYEGCDDCESIVNDTRHIRDSDLCNQCARGVIENIITECNSCSNEDGLECEECSSELEVVIPIVFNVNAFGIADRWWSCATCGERRLGLPIGTNAQLAEMLATEEYGEAICDRCHSEDGSPVAYRVLNYTHKPPPRFKRTDRDFDNRSLHFGTEVEVDVADGVHRDAALVQLGPQDTARLFYCKHDVSTVAGFEIVTHPFTYDWMRQNPEAFQPMFDLATLMRGFESVKCGMHVHMSKDAFSELQMFKFMRFFHMNTKFIRSLARRPKGRFDRWAQIVVPERSSLMRFTLNKEHIDFKRGALNMENKDTIECRIFRSSLAPTAYYGNIEFLQGLFDYTKNCGVNDDQLTKDRFMDYIYDRGKAYKNFVLLTETLRPQVEDNWEVECA